MKTCPVCDTPYPDKHSNCPTDGAVLIESRELAPDHIVRGKYRIVRKLGQGGMGEVYLAEHILLGGKVALKFLAVELSRNPSFIKRFRQEARAAYQIRHPNIVEVVDLDQDEDGNLFIAMEYVSGPSLRMALQQAPGGFSVARSVQIARGLASGLATAHAHGAVHRDIKPENILLSPDSGGGESPKVLDFGIAAMAEGITNLSRTRGLLLTPEYAAPEQWRGTPATQLDGRTDLYALGGVLYEMLTGHTAFHAHNMEGWMYMHLTENPKPLTAVRPELASTPGLCDLTLRLLAKNRDDRPASAVALIQEIQQFENLPRAASPSVPPIEVRPDPRPRVADTPVPRAGDSGPHPLPGSPSVTPRFCRMCGVSLRPETKFCTDCGAPVSSTATPSVSGPVPINVSGPVQRPSGGFPRQANTPAPPTFGQYGAPPAVAPPAQSSPNPPNLPWGIVLLLSLVTVGLFMWIWAFVIAGYVRKLRPGSNAIGLYIFGFIGMISGSLFSAFGGSDVPPAIGVLLYLGGVVMCIVGSFSIRRSLVEYFNSEEPIGLRLSGAMTFFFHVLYFQYHLSRIRNWRETGVLK